MDRSLAVVFSQRARAALRERKLSHSAAAKRMIPPRHGNTITHWLGGKSQPALDDLEELARVLGVSVGWLIGAGTATRQDRSVERVANYDFIIRDDSNVHDERLLVQSPMQIIQAIAALPWWARKDVIAPRFVLGTITATKAIRDYFAERRPSETAIELVALHAVGHWGDVDNTWRKDNDRLAKGKEGTIVSFYKLPEEDVLLYRSLAKSSGNRTAIVVKTNAPRSMTTIMFDDQI